MSITHIRAALETALNGMSPALATAWQNTPYTPIVGTPYQRVNLLTAEPSNQEFGASYTEAGYMQVDLCYPQTVGAGVVEQRFELIRTTFKRGMTFLNGGITTTISATPELAPAYIDGDRFVRPVKIRFHAYISQ